MSETKKAKQQFGVVFAQPSTTAVGKNVWCSSVAGIDDELVKAIREEKDWRHKYSKHVAAIKARELQSYEATMKIAQQGLDALEHPDNFAFVTPNGETISIPDAFADNSKTFKAGFVKGSAVANEKISILKNGKAMESADAIEMVKGWVEYGCAEPSVVDMVQYPIEKANEVKDYLKDSVFVLLGGTSELGPVQPLLDLGATVVAIARRGQKLASLIDDAQTRAGTLIVPLPDSFTGDENSVEDFRSIAGADLMTDGPALGTWLGKEFEKYSNMIVYSLAYLDGANHVRVSVSNDQIGQKVMKLRGDKPTNLAFMGSPATAYCISLDAHRACGEAFRKSSFMTKMVGEKAQEPLVKGVTRTGEETEFAMTNGLITFQGPNYALAKTLQQWRAMVARETGKQIVSFNMTPPARTASVQHSRQAAAGLEGAAVFAPNRAFDADTTSSVMCAMLLHDCINPDSPANPNVLLDNPNQLTLSGALHGGAIRSAFTFDSVGKLAFLMGILGYKVK